MNVVGTLIYDHDMIVPGAFIRFGSGSIGYYVDGQLSLNSLPPWMPQQPYRDGAAWLDDHELYVVIAVLSDVMHAHCFETILILSSVSNRVLWVRREECSITFVLDPYGKHY